MRKKILLLFAVGVAFFYSDSYAQQKKTMPSWKENAVDSSVSLERKPKRATKETGYFLVLPAKEDGREALVGNKLEVYQKEKAGYLVIKASPEELYQHRELFKEAWQVNNKWKLSGDFEESSATKKEVYTIKTIAPQKTLHTLDGLPDLTILSVSDSRIQFASTYEVLTEKVIVLEEVVYAAREATDPTTEAPVTDMNLVANGINRIHHTYPELNGEGMTLSIQEMGFDPEDMDLLGRDIPSSLRAPSIGRHATEMATIAAGAGNSFITGKGVAWAARITSSDFEDVLPDADTAYRDLDAWVQNHSYGTEIENFYGTLAEAFDISATENPALLHVISSGNNGLAAGKGPYEGVTGYGNLTGNFKMAKNILTVGAVDTLGRPMFFSSNGPAYDGRVKPELSAYSTTGSSNATALVSGLSILLQQGYKEQEGSLPASALIKATLINSASDAGKEGLDFETGYGNVNGFKALENLLARRYFSGTIGQGETQTISLEVPVNVRDLKLTLVWTDPAASPGSGVALVNDVDMVLANETASWLPWVLDTRPDAASLSRAAVRGEDHLNNVEQITVNAPEAGLYSISISGYHIPEGVQHYYIAYQWEEENRFSWAYPTGSDPMPYNGESTGYFRWESSMEAATGRLEYSLDGGASWQLIEEAVELEKEAYRWAAPEVGELARARMTIGQQVFTTDAFALSRPLKTSVGFVCGDSVLIQWNRLAAATAYEVFAMGNTSMEPVETTTDTLLVLNSSEYPSRLFAVRPLLEGKVPAIRSMAFDYALQGTNCYLISFFSELTVNEQIFLNLQLGTHYQVEEVAFERKVAGQWEPVSVTAFPEHADFRVPDSTPLQGLNTYRAVVRLINGKEIITEEDRNYYLSGPPLIVFPNPVSASGGLRVYSRFSESQILRFRLYDPAGKLVAQSALTSDRAYVPLNNALPPGLYVYSVELEGRTFQGRLLVK